VHEREGKVVSEMFQKYASGTMTLSLLAVQLNKQGFRTRNMHKLTGPNGVLMSGPRLFTTSSVRGILHNPFYTGKVSCNGELLPGLHEALVTEELFDILQSTMRRNSGRSETLQVKPEREYLLKGIVRCIYCGMPMWAQTYKSGRSYYREHKASRSLALCQGSSITCSVIDDQISKLVEAIELGPRWLEEVLYKISLKDEVVRVKNERQSVLEKLRRMGKAYVDGVFDDAEYQRQKKLLELKLESLVVPQANAAEEAGKLILDIPRLWGNASMTERRNILLTMLDAVYVDARKSKSIVAIKPKPPSKPVFQ
jgi:hypothetical protein